MGFRFVEAFNVALAMKQYWRIMVDENSLLARVLKGKCFPKSMLGTVGKGYKLSFSWSSIMVAKWIIDEGCIWRIGNGRVVKVFKDKWVPNLLGN